MLLDDVEVAEQIEQLSQWEDAPIEVHMDLLAAAAAKALKAWQEMNPISNLPERLDRNAD